MHAIPNTLAVLRRPTMQGLLRWLGELGCLRMHQRAVGARHLATAAATQLSSWTWMPSCLRHALRKVPGVVDSWQRLRDEQQQMDGRRRSQYELQRQYPSASIVNKPGAIELTLSPPSAALAAAAAIAAAVATVAPAAIPLIPLELLLQGLPGCNGLIAPLILPPLLHFEHPLAAGHQQSRASAGPGMRRKAQSG